VLFRQFWRSPRFLFILGFTLYGFVFFKNAWVSDDAYILFRSLDQLLSGHGPRWNPHERVQVFTCPLWYWLLAGMGWLHRDHYLNSIILSAVCNALLLWNLHKIFTSPPRWLLAVLMLVFSQAYFDFTSSGLENPLVYCLLSFVARFYLDEQLPEKQKLLRIGITIGLLLVTRHDAALFVLPLLAHNIIRYRQQSMPMLFAALLPLAVWTLFSLIYYGFPFPNTAYAKLSAVIPREFLLQRGITYFSTSLLRDFISLAILTAGLLIGMFNKRTTLRCLTLGVLLHLAYVVWIGGDFMRGRFFGWDYLLCVILLLQWRVHYRVIAIGFAAVASISWFFWTPPLATPAHWGAEPFRMGDSADGVTQERYFFFWFTRFTRYLQRGDEGIHDFGWCQDGNEQRNQGIAVAASHTVGMHGFCLGTEGKMVDLLGITDPLLARMPHNPAQKNWRAGHFLRVVPEGYCSSVLHNSNEIVDPVIARYYDSLRLITQSEPLFSKERLQAIWQINTGAFNEELTTARAHLLSQPTQTASNLSSCPFVVLPDAVIERLRNPKP
jgi:arabinofuranosyltransferase